MVAVPEACDSTLPYASSAWTVNDIGPLGAGTAAEHEIVLLATVQPGELGESAIVADCPLIVINSALVYIEKYMRCFVATCVEYGSEIVKSADPVADAGPVAAGSGLPPPPPQPEMSAAKMTLVHNHAKLIHLILVVSYRG